MIKRDEVQLQLTVEQKEAINKISAYRNTLKQLSGEMELLEKRKKALEKKSSNWSNEERDEYFKVVNAINATKEKMDAYSKSIDYQREKAGLMGRTTKDLRAEYRQLMSELNNLVEGTEEFTKKQERLDEVADALAKKKSFRAGVSNVAEETTSMFADMSASLIGGIAGGIAGALVNGVTSAMGTIRQLVDEGIAYVKERTRDISDIQSTLNISNSESVKMLDQLNNINTETSRKELKELVLVAGDLNVAKKDVLGFVETADKIGVAFQRDFSSAGDAVEMIAKLNENFRETKGLGINEGLLKTGSVIRTLNEDGAASTKGITEFMNRIGQLPDAVKPTIAETAALAAVLEEAGLTAEISSGGISNVLITAAQNGEEFGRVFKMSKKDFLDFMTTNPGQFLLRLAEIVKQTDKTQVGELFQQLKIGSQEAQKAIGSLSTNIDKFKDKTEKSIKSISEGTRIDEVFRVFNEDGAAQINKAEKKFEIFWDKVKGFFGNAGKSLMVDLAKVLPDTTSKVDELTRKFEQQKDSAHGLEKNILPLVNRIEELRAKSKLSNEEQAELKKNIELVGNVLPDSITKMNEYAVAIDVNTAAARRNIVEQMKLAENSKKDDLKALQNEIIDTDRKINNLTTGIQYQIDYAKKWNKGGQLYESQKQKIEADKNEIIVLQEKKKSYEELYHYVLKGVGTIEQRRASRKAAKESAQSTDTIGLDIPDDKAAKEAEKLAETKIANEIRVNNETTQMQLEAIANAKERELALLQFKVSEALLAEAEKVKNGELSEETFVSFATALHNDWVKKKTQIDVKYYKATEDEGKKSAERLKKIREDITLQILDNDIQAAKNSGNDFEAMQLEQLKNEKKAEQEIAIISAEQLSADDIEIYTALEQKKAQIREKYRQENITLEKDFFKKVADEDVKETQDAEKKKREEKEKTEKAARELEQKRQMYSRLGEEALNSIVDLMHQRKINQIAAEENALEEAHQKRLDDLEVQKNTGILTEEEYQAKRTELEKIHAAEQKRLRREQAIADRNAAIFKATLDMLGAIIANLKNGVVASVAAGVIGALNLAKIIGTPIPELYTGGYVPDGKQALPIGLKKPSSTAVLSWLNERGTEYVIPAEELSNPEVRDFVDNYIEPSRKQRIGIATHADGGYVGNKMTANTGATSNNDVMTSVLEVLREIRDKDNKVKQDWSDIDKLDRALAKLQKQKQNGYYSDGL